METTMTGKEFKRGFVVLRASEALQPPTTNMIFVLNLSREMPSFAKARLFINDELPALVASTPGSSEKILVAGNAIEKVFAPTKGATVDDNNPMVQSLKSTEIYQTLLSHVMPDVSSDIALWKTFILLSLNDNFWSVEGLPSRPSIDDPSTLALLNRTKRRIGQLVCMGCEVNE